MEWMASATAYVEKTFSPPIVTCMHWERGSGRMLSYVRGFASGGLRLMHKALSLFGIDTEKQRLICSTFPCTYTQPVGFGSPATLQAPLAGPLGNSS